MEKVTMMEMEREFIKFTDDVVLRNYSFACSDTGFHFPVSLKLQIDDFEAHKDRTEFVFPLQIETVDEGSFTISTTTGEKVLVKVLNTLSKKHEIMSSIEFYKEGVLAGNVTL